MKQKKRIRLALNKIKIASLKNPETLYGGDVADPDGDFRYTKVNSCYVYDTQSKSRGVECTGPTDSCGCEDSGYDDIIGYP